MKTDCKYRVVARKEDNGNGWKMGVLENNHNHGPVACASALPQHRTAAITPEERAKIKQMNSENQSAGQILLTLRCANPDSMLIPRDIYNLLAGLRTEELGGKTPIEWLLNVCPYSFIDPVIAC
jgi:hypothetical protein